ncbi:hypothetical protein DICPUDRAFT_155741 [Dictyostelium purpureum]|uniref:SAP domain-containing protein n=1 Tax=Dictyostelium purpureum TaxID=5786 RepID=F0ZUS1_DICPU|nr:uncharacterized protein DICPUDRAFT_155741 [Dictyostelium purpureum]EGC32315.1 hypothetical protein DICPUDRAFT_155741 [Dictyostelium purpureum]|eukprot:XP_003291157.1 hypothetical protein DICPUDRAFT_155741 [Dictyostelium purpureum]
MLDINNLSKLKVTELKKELENRGFEKTSGLLKANLIEKLKELLLKEQTTQQEEEFETETGETNNEKLEKENLEKDKLEKEKLEKEKLEKEKLEKEKLEKEKLEKEKLEKEKLEKEKLEKEKLEKEKLEKEKLEKEKLEKEKLEKEKLEKEKLEKEKLEKEKLEKEKLEKEKLENEKIEKNNKEKDNEKKLEDHTSKKRKYDDINKNDNSNNINNKEKDIESLNKKVHTSENINDESKCTILITKLVRPFRVDAFEKLINQYGQGTEHYWLNNIKSKAYVTFFNSNDAAIAMKSLDGLTWPELNRTKLVVESSTLEESEYQKKKELGLLTNDNSKNTRQPPKDNPKDNNQSQQLTKESPSYTNKSIDSLFFKTKAEPSIYWCLNSKSQTDDRKRVHKSKRRVNYNNNSYNRRSHYY